MIEIPARRLGQVSAAEKSAFGFVAFGFVAFGFVAFGFVLHCSYRSIVESKAPLRQRQPRPCLHGRNIRRVDRGSDAFTSNWKLSAVVACPERAFTLLMSLEFTDRVLFTSPTRNPIEAE